jgi:hypothetical protein
MKKNPWNILWSIPVITAYLYATTILTQYGYNSYFNIPPSFIEASIRANVIYYFQLFTIIGEVAGLFKWWQWSITIGAIIIVVMACYVESIYRNIVFIIGIFFLFLTLWGSVSIGSFLAKNIPTFLVPSSTCYGIGEDKSYIIPVIYDNDAILIPIDTSTLKMTGGFIVKDIPTMSCKLEYKNVGLIKN